MNGRPHYKHEGIGFVPVEHPSQPRGNQCPDAGSTKRRGTKLRSSACRHFSRHDTPRTIGDSLAHAFVRTPVKLYTTWCSGMFGGLRRREHAVADQAFAFTADNNNNFAHNLDLRLPH
jgi:hypothetical protein